MYAIDIENLQKRYKNGTQALTGINLQIKEGDFFALLGQNGAGKTTTIGILSSLVKKTTGKVRIFGVDIDDDFAKAKSYLGIVPQEFNFNSFEKVIDIVTNQAGYYGITLKVARQRAKHYLSALGLWSKHKQAARNLSGGMKRRLLIARALIHQPRLLILDEPTAGVDIELRRLLWHFLKKVNSQGTTVILTTHYLEEAEYLCRNVAIIHCGTIITHSTMANLLRKLDRETFILDVKNPIPKTLQLNNIAMRRINNYTLEVDLWHHYHLNELFAQLSKQNIVITSMRNKVNRLEALFVKLTTTQPS